MNIRPSRIRKRSKPKPKTPAPEIGPEERVFIDRRLPESQAWRFPAGTYRLIVRNEASDDSVLTYLSTELRVLEPQSGSAGIDPPPIAWEYLDAVPVVRTDVDQGLSDVAVAQALENLRLNHANGGLRILVNSTGGLELGLWNDTLTTWRVLRLTGAGLDEQVTFDDLP